MDAWRLCSPRFRASAMSGEGARLSPGRWNARGTRMVYCGTTLSLAVLEMQVQAGDMLPIYDAFKLHVPDGFVTRVEVGQLRDGWRDDVEATRQIGESWVEQQTSVGLLVPSSVVPQEMNLLLNPLHPDFGRVSWGAPSRFQIDPRLFKE